MEVKQISVCNQSLWVLISVRSKRKLCFAQARYRCCEVTSSHQLPVDSRMNQGKGEIKITGYMIAFVITNVKIFYVILSKKKQKK